MSHFPTSRLSLPPSSPLSLNKVRVARVVPHSNLPVRLSCLLPLPAVLPTLLLDLKITCGLLLQHKKACVQVREATEGGGLISKPVIAQLEGTPEYLTKMLIKKLQETEKVLIKFCTSLGASLLRLNSIELINTCDVGSLLCGLSVLHGSILGL